MRIGTFGRFEFGHVTDIKNRLVNEKNRISDHKKDIYDEKKPLKWIG